MGTGPFFPLGEGAPVNDKKKCCTRRMQPSDTPLSALDMDVLDFGFLTAARYFCDSLANPHGQAWIFAVLAPECFFPGANSAEKMRRALAVVQEMRTSRRSTFQFSNPRCEGCASIVTQDERHLLQLVQHARNGQRSRVASSALLLCEGHAKADVILAAHQFAEAVGVPQPGKVIA